jgi:hypothetical protein
MTDWRQGKIYKIVSDQTDKVYIGSTVRLLENRLSSHVSETNKCKSNDIILNCTDYRIEWSKNN